MSRTVDAEERAAFAEGVRQAFGRPDADTALAELGWTDALAEWGGAAIETVFTEQGRARATSTALDDVLLAALGLTGQHAVALSPVGSRETPGRLGPDGLSVAGVASSRIVGATLVVVAGGVAVTVPAAALSIRPLGGIDPDAGLMVVEGSVPREDFLDETDVAWTDALAAAQLALACELVGLSRSMLALAREHALSRVQFDRPISGFQAVRHKLADTLVAIEGAAAGAGAAADDLSLAPLAKALAGKAARLTAKHAQQVLAGIGFTAEHAFHRHLKRAMLLDELAGSARVLAHELGEQILATGHAPVTLPL